MTRIVVNNTTRTAYVQMPADVSPLFPEPFQVRPIWAWGGAGAGSWVPIAKEAYRRANGGAEARPGFAVTPSTPRNPA